MTCLMYSQETRAQRGRGTYQKSHSRFTAYLLVPHSCFYFFNYLSDLKAKNFGGYSHEGWKETNGKGWEVGDRGLLGG